MFFPVLKSKTHPLKGLGAFLVFFSGFLIIWAIDRVLIRKLKRKPAMIIISALLATNVALQVLCLMNLTVNPSWDFGVIMKAAGDISSGHTIGYWKYFQEYPYNLYSAVYIAAFKTLFSGYAAAPYLLNMLSVTASIAGACLLAYRLYGHRAAVLAAFFCLAFTPFYLNIPIVYTDTLSMPFVIWTVYAWTYIPAGKGKPVLLYGFILGALSAVGFLIKQIAAIGLIAFTVDFILSEKEYNVRTLSSKKHLLNKLSHTAPLAVSVASFALVFYSSTLYLGYMGFGNRTAVYNKFPYTHWLMMGMNKSYSEGGTSYGYGGFSAEDLKFTRLFRTTSAMKEANIAVIRARLNRYGVPGYAKFLLKKAEWTWTDGAYFVPAKLARYPLKRTALHKIVLSSNGKMNTLFRIFAQFTQTLMLSMILTGCISALLKGTGGAFRLMALMSLGLMVFLLFWEARSRYLIFMLPVFVVMTVQGFLIAFKGLDRIVAYIRRIIRIFLRT